MTEGAVTSFLGFVGEFFTEAVTWLGDVLNIVTDNPALFVMVLAMPICGFAVGLLGRLIRL